MIRAAVSEADLAAVRELFLEYSGGLGVDLCFQDFDAELRGLPGEYVPPNGALLVAEVADEIFGCVCLRPLEAAGVAEMKRLFVRPAGRGKGLGAALTQAVLRFARDAGYTRVRLDTLPSMQRAQALYRSLGFNEIPAYRRNPVPGSLFLELALDAE